MARSTARRATTSVRVATPAAGGLGLRTIVLGLFLFSGASGLIYEVVWSRMFALVLGTTVYAVSTVLGVFMGGLALGSWLCGRLADRPGAHGLRMYAWLELGTGVFALLLPALMRLSDAIYRGAYPAVEDSFAGLMAVRLLLAAMILIVPSTLMGGTLPVLSRFLVRSRDRTGMEIGTLYAVNTLGAVLGCLVAGFFLLEYLGVRLALLSAALLNFAVGATALLLSRRAPAAAADATPARPAANVRRYGSSQIRLALLLYAVSGFAALALEVLWMRSLMYFTSVDTYAFTAMLAAFLSGIGLGSLVMARYAGRLRNPLLVLGVIEVLIGGAAAMTIPLFARLYGAYMSLLEALPQEATLYFKITTKLFCSFFIMLVPTLLMGAAFPLISAIYVGARRRVGRGTGTLYALNTMGAIGGSVAAGFVLIPVLGLQRSMLLCASLYVALGLVLIAAAPRHRNARRAGLAATVLAAIVLLLVNRGFNARPAILNSAFFKNPDRPFRLRFFHEGAAASLAVIEDPIGTKLLNINGITTAINNRMDMQVHRMLSHLPLLLHPDPKTVLVVGFGMGSTAWGCCQHDVQRVDVVELLRAERRTAPLFADVNHGVLDHPKLNFIEGDGRNYLLATDESYDVISFNAIHPRYSAYLYTTDFYDLCRRKLSDGGVICAWMTQNSMLDHEFRMLCRSFVEVFPNASLWYSNPEHFCLIGTMQPTRIDLTAWQERLSIEAVRSDLAASGLDDPFVLLGRYLLGGDALAAYVAGAPLNTDDQPRAEFTRSSKADERAIIEKLIGLRENVLPLVEAGMGGGGDRGGERGGAGAGGGDRAPGEAGAGAAEVRQRLAAHEEASRWLMIGQTDHWYPLPGRRLKPEIGYRRALLACPDDQDVRQNLVFSRTVRDRMQRELAAAPDNVGALARMGSVLLEEGRLREAERYLARALELRPAFVPAAERLAYVLLWRGELEESVRRFRQALESRPYDPRPRYAYGVALEHLGKTRQAAAQREQALREDRDVAEWFTLFEQTVRLLGSGAGAQPAPGSQR